MATRYQTEYGFITIDTNNEDAPTEFIAGPFMVNVSEADLIKDGAEIEVNEAGTDVVVTMPVEVL